MIIKKSEYEALTHIIKTLDTLIYRKEIIAFKRIIKRYEITEKEKTQIKLDNLKARSMKS